MIRPVDVMGVMIGLEDLARHRLLMKRRDFDRMQAKGITPHPVVVAKAERAEYLREQASEARAAIAELIEADKALQFIRANGCSHDEYDAATARHDAALARVTPMTPEQQAEQAQVRG